MLVLLNVLGAQRQVRLRQDAVEPIDGPASANEEGASAAGGLSG